MYMIIFLILEDNKKGDLMEKAIIVGVQHKNSQYDLKYSLDELTNLALSDEIMVVDVITQILDNPTPNFYVGKGKVDEIIISINANEPDMVIFDDELTPSQLRNLEQKLDIKIIDRSLLILDIFAKRAKTREAILEIKLSQNKYLLPRLSSMTKNFSRQAGTTGGFSSKGPGEKQIELDRRQLSVEIYRIQEELLKIKQMKDLQIKKRQDNEIPVVALVGYTNAGKSSTMNSIIEYTNKDEDKMVLAEDKLFATLNTHARKISYNKHDFLLIDTVGFVSKLPHSLVNSFKQTLEEIRNADLIIHVVDISSRYFETQFNVTNDVLHNLGCNNIKTLVLLNKYDNYDDQNSIITGVENLPFSNKTKLNLDTLMEYIYNSTIPQIINMNILIPYKNGKDSNFIEEKAIIKSKVYTEDGILYDIELDKKYYKNFSVYEVNNNIN